MNERAFRVKYDSTNFAARLSNAELSAISNDIADVYDSVRKADIDEDLQRVVLDSLEQLRRAVNEYRLRGSAGLQEEVERAAARLARYAKDLRSTTPSPWAMAYVDLLVKIDVAVHKGKTYLELITGVSDLLRLTDSK